MNKDLAVFTGALLIVSVITGLVALQLTKPSFLILILTVLAATTWLVYVFIERKNRADLVKNYMLTIVLKLLAGGIFIFILLYVDKSGANANAIVFMVAYLLFTALEVGFLFRKLGRS